MGGASATRGTPTLLGRSQTVPIDTDIRTYLPAYQTPPLQHPSPFAAPRSATTAPVGARVTVMKVCQHGCLIEADGQEHTFGGSGNTKILSPTADCRVSIHLKVDICLK